MGRIGISNINTSMVQAGAFLLESNVGSVYVIVYPPHLSEKVR